MEKPDWMPDGDCDSCIGCRTPFGAFRRKHHVRLEARHLLLCCPSFVFPHHFFSTLFGLTQCRTCGRIFWCVLGECCCAHAWLLTPYETRLTPVCSCPPSYECSSKQVDVKMAGPGTRRQPTLRRVCDGCFAVMSSYGKAKVDARRHVRSMRGSGARKR